MFFFVCVNAPLHDISPDRAVTPFDRYGTVKYKRHCKQLGINPIGIVLRGLKSEWFDVSGRGLHNQDILLVCRALIVRLHSFIYGIIFIVSKKLTLI